MIKVECVEVEKKTKSIEYPIIMESVSNGAVILFTELTSGVLLRPGLAGERIGDWSDDWIRATYSEAWRPYKGEIKLYNSGE